MHLDGVLVLAHTDKQDAAETWKKTFRSGDGTHEFVDWLSARDGWPSYSASTTIRFPAGVWTLAVTLDDEVRDSV